jgi:hypothetical protein
VEYDPFISTDDLEAILGVTLANPNALIVKISLDTACTAVRTYLGQAVNLVEDDIEKRHGNGHLRMRLKQRPVRAVASVTIDDVELTTDRWKLKDSTIWLTEGDMFWRGILNVEIEYDHGWDLTDVSGDMGVPADIRFVALESARRVYKSVADSAVPATALQSETIGSYSYTLAALPPEVASAVVAAGSLLPGEMDMIYPYRIGLVP